MSEAVILAIVTLVSNVFNLIFQYWTKRSVDKTKASIDTNTEITVKSANDAELKRVEIAKDQAEKVETVRTDLKQNTEKLDETHSLVNSKMEAQLKINVYTTEKLAKLTNDPADIEAARLAKIAFESHLVQQAKIDLEKRKK